MTTTKDNNIAIGVPFLRLGEKQVGRRLQLYRRMKGFSQIELAKKVGISQTKLSRIERDPRIAKVGQIQSLCSLLGITVFDLLGDTPVEFTIDKAKMLRVRDLARLPLKDG